MQEKLSYEVIFYSICWPLSLEQKQNDTDNMIQYLIFVNEYLTYQCFHIILQYWSFPFSVLIIISKSYIIPILKRRSNCITVNLTAMGISEWSQQYGYLDEKPVIIGKYNSGIQAVMLMTTCYLYFIFYSHVFLNVFI